MVEDAIDGDGSADFNGCASKSEDKDLGGYAFDVIRCISRISPGTLLFHKEIQLLLGPNGFCSEKDGCANEFPSGKSVGSTSTLYNISSLKSSNSELSDATPPPALRKVQSSSNVDSSKFSHSSLESRDFLKVSEDCETSENPVRSPGTQIENQGADVEDIPKALPISYPNCSEESTVRNSVSLTEEHDKSMGVVVDLKVLNKGDKLPEGYSRVIQFDLSSQRKNNGKRNRKPSQSKVIADINRGGNGRSVYLCVKRHNSTCNPPLRPITAISIIFTGKREVLPPGFTVISRTVSGQSADVSSCFKTNSSQAFLCYCRGNGPPITDLAFLCTDSLPLSLRKTISTYDPSIFFQKLLPPGYTPIDRSPMGYSTAVTSTRAPKTSNGSSGIGNSINVLCVSYGMSSIDSALKERETETKECETENCATVHEKEEEKAEENAKANHDTDIGNQERSQKEIDAYYPNDFHAKIRIDLNVEPALLELVRPLIFACYSGHPKSILLALHCLETLICGNMFPPNQASASNNTDDDKVTISLLDFVIKVASDCAQMGSDILYAPAVNVVLAAVRFQTVEAKTDYESGISSVGLYFAAFTIYLADCFAAIIPPGFYLSVLQKNSSCMSVNSSVRTSRSASVIESDSVNSITLGKTRVRSRSLITSYSSPIPITSETDTESVNPTIPNKTVGGNVRISNASTISPLSRSRSSRGNGSRRSFASFVSMSDLDTTLTMVDISDLASQDNCNPTVSKQDIAYLAQAANELFQLVVLEEKHKTTYSEDKNYEENIARNIDTESITSFIQGIIIEDLLDRVTGLQSRMKITDEAFRSLSSCSDTTGVDIVLGLCHHCRRLTTNSCHQNIFMLLMWLSKIGFVDPYSNVKSLNMKAKMASKECGISLLISFLSVAASSSSSEGSFTNSATFGYVVRRFAFHVALFNMSTEFLPINLKLLSVLWKYNRKHLKTEFAVVLENILVCVLRSRYSQPDLKKEVLETLISWFGMHPVDLVELFLNFENDSCVRHWKTFQRLIETVCAIGEHTTRACPVFLNETTNDKRIRDDLQHAALSTLVTLLRLLSDASANVHLMSRDENVRQRSVKLEGEYGWEEAELETPRTATTPDSITHDSALPHNTRTKNSEKEDGKSSKCKSRLVKRSSVRVRHELQEQHKQVLGDAIKLAREKSVKKAINYLVANAYVEDNASCIAQLLHVYRKQFGERAIGDYLGELGPNEEFKTQVRLEFTKALPFAGKSFEAALRLFLTNGGFILPGESQKISALLESFAHCYVLANRDSFSDVTAVELLAYSTVMLNTSLHNPNARGKTFSADQFYTQISYVENLNLTKEEANILYDSILKNEIRIKTETDEGHGDNVPNTYIGGVEGRSNQEVKVSREQASENFEGEMSEALRTSWAIVSSGNMQCLVYHSKMSSDSIRLMFELVWVHYYGIVTTILENPKTYSLEIVSLALDILRHSISASLFLGMETERRAFATLLAKLHYIHSDQWENEGKSKVQEKDGGEKKPPESLATMSLATGKHLERKWFNNVMNASCEQGNIYDVIAEVHHLTSSMKEQVILRESYEKLLSIQKRFHTPVLNLDKSSTTKELIREGTLLKRSRKTKHRKYLFFLFNDFLIYAHQKLASSKLIAHQRLPLQTMRIVDKPDESFTFEILSPVKSFVVQTLTPSEKVAWMRDLNDAINKINSCPKKSGAIPPLNKPKSISNIITCQVQDGDEADDEEENMEEIGNDIGEPKPNVLREKKNKATANVRTADPKEKIEYKQDVKTDESIKNLSGEELNRVFFIALRFAKPILMGQHDALRATDSQKLLLYGYFKQSTVGECNIESPAADQWMELAKYKAWSARQGLSKQEAMRKFISVLNIAAPGWHRKVT